MRSDAKASTAGSTERRGARRRKPALLLLLAAACVAALTVVVGSASGSTTRFLEGTFGSSAQPTFPADRGIAVDQSTGEVYVLDATEDTVYRFNSNGTPSNFSALGSSEIDGEGTGDETPQGGLSIPNNRKESQIAIDESGTATDGDIYVAGGSAHRVDIFASSGEYKGQLTEYTGGALGETCGVAVGPTGDVYVGDYSHGVHVYEPAANPPVNGDNSANFTTAANPCTLAAGAGATAGYLFVDRYNGELLKLDAATGEAKYAIATGGSTVSVDPSTGHVFSARNTGSSSSIDEYDASGAGEASLVSSFRPGSTAEGVAVNGSAEEVYVSRSGTENVEVYGATKVVPDVVTEAPSSNTGVRASLAGTVNPDGVELSECFFEWGEGSGNAAYTETTPCAETPAEIGTGTAPVAVHADIDGLIPQGKDYHYRLVAANPNGMIDGSNQNFTTPDTVLTEAASGVTPTEATLNGSVNPDTASLSECVFEWGEKASVTDAFQGYEVAPCVPSPSGASPVAVHADLSGLHPGTIYVYRLRVGYPGAVITDPRTSQTPLSLLTAGPAIDGSWSEGVTYTEATLKAQINPEGSPTTYRFEYGKTSSYGSETEELSAGSDGSNHLVSHFFEDLELGTTYHWRVVATNGVAENVGPDHVLTTYAHEAPQTDCANRAYRTGLAANLPDCRAYEMVSPISKNGINIKPPFCCGSTGIANYEQSSLDGEKITYAAGAAFGDQVGAANANQYIATRHADGWSSHGINPPLGVDVFAPLLPNPQYQLDTPFQNFSDDLSTAWVLNGNKASLTPDAMTGFGNLYERDNASDSFQALTIGTPTSYAGGEYNRGLGTEFRGVSADGSDQVFDTEAALTPDAATTKKRQVYDFSAGSLHLVSVLPNGTAAPEDSSAGTFGLGNAAPTINHTNSRIVNAVGAVSADGSRIFWTDGGAQNFGSGMGEGGHVYLRENPAQPPSALNGSEECTEPGKACTIPVSGTVSSEKARFWGADPAGETAIFSVHTGDGVAADGLSDLYRFDVATQTSSLIAGEVAGVVGMSRDTSYLYFVSLEALAPGATASAFNLYVRHNGVTTFIGSLASGDASKEVWIGSSIPFSRDSRVTPDGRHIAFQSVASLTGYDNTDVKSGEADSEVYTYEVGGDLVCVSCNRSGSRPEGERLPFPYAPPTFSPLSAWSAAWLPTWGHELHPSHVLSDDGRHLFFNSFDSLLPRDSNGQMDVYEWDSQGTGGCTNPNGCIALISTGTSASYSEFVDASADGRDVFFRTEESLDPRDPGLVDIYDARVGGGFPQPASPPPCVGDSCQSPPEAPQRSSLSSSGFHGAGSPVRRVGRNCGAPEKKANRLRRRARRVSRNARRVSSRRRSAILHRRSVRLRRRANVLRRRAARCRRAERRAKR